MNKKTLAHILWIFVALIIGVSISYGVSEGSARAYGELYEKTRDLMVAYVEPDMEIVPINPLPPKNKIVPEKAPGISLGFVGDIIPGLFPAQNLFEAAIPYTSKPDIMLGNFEGTRTDTIYTKCKIDSKNCFAFNGSRNFIDLLTEASFDVLNVANNHFNDYGKIGQDETVTEIENVGITPSGLRDVPVYISKNNLTVAVLGFSTYSWTEDMNNSKKLKSIIEKENARADVVVVFFHGGGEGLNYAHTPVDNEWYLNEDRGDVREFAHNAIAAGADIVVGSGPHLLRGMEWYRGKLVAYSLGNFASANSTLTNGALKTSALLEVTLNPEGFVTSGMIHSFEIDGYGIPHPDPKQSAIEMVNNLSQEDFGENGVVLSPFGEISI